MIIEQIDWEIESWSKLKFSAPMQRFIRRNGMQFNAAPFVGKRGKPKHCFENATLARKGTYVEGYAIRKDLPLLIHHAWRVDEKGNVIDSTWDAPQDCEFFGIKFSNSELACALDELNHYGVIDTPIGLNYKLMLKIDPGMKEFLPERLISQLSV